MADELVAPKRTTGKEAIASEPKPAVRDLQRRFEKLAHKDAALVEDMNRFADLPDEEFKELKVLMDTGQLEELKKRGWSVRSLRVALAARQPKSTVPFAMIAAHERTGMRIRKLQAKAASTKVNVAVITIHERAPRKTDAEVHIVEDKK